MTFYFCVRHGYVGKTNNLRHPNGYLCNFVFRNKRRKKGRPFGGVLVYFRNELNKVVSVFDKANENILWIRAGKEFLE